MAAALDYSNHSFSARDRIEKYAEVFTGSHTLNNLYGNVLAKTLRKGYNSDKFNASEVYPNLWVGDVYAAHNTAELKKRGFTHIVNCVPGVNPAFPSEFKYLHIPLLDCATEAICEKFNQSSDFIHEALSNHGRVLVHCLQGMSRSATIASAYVMKALHVSAQEAVEILQEKRGIVKPNYGFMIQLETFEKQMDKDINKEHKEKEKAAIAAGKPAEVAVQESWRRASVCPEVNQVPAQSHQQPQQQQKSSWRGRRASVCPEMLSGAPPQQKSSFGASLRARLTGSSEMNKPKTPSGSRRSSVSVEMSPMNNSSGSNKLSNSSGGSNNNKMSSPMVSSPMSNSNNSPRLPALQPPQQLSGHRRASVVVLEVSSSSSSSTSYSSPQLKAQPQQAHHQHQQAQQQQPNWRLSSCPDIVIEQPAGQQASAQAAGQRRSSACPEVANSPLLSPYGHFQQDCRRASIF